MKTEDVNVMADLKRLMSWSVGVFEAIDEELARLNRKSDQDDAEIARLKAIIGSDNESDTHDANGVQLKAGDLVAHKNDIMAIWKVVGINGPLWSVEPITDAARSRRHPAAEEVRKLT